MKNLKLLFNVNYIYYSNQTMAKRPQSALGNRRPLSDYAKVASAMGGNPRFKVIHSELLC
jgi:hypothetical protein